MRRGGRLWPRMRKEEVLAELRRCRGRGADEGGGGCGAADGGYDWRGVRGGGAWSCRPAWGTHVNWDERMDGLLAQAVMSLQAVKAVELGRGGDGGGVDGFDGA